MASLTPPVAVTRVLAEIASQARTAYMEKLAGHGGHPWWTALILTASSERQAERYRAEVERRRHEGTLPPGVRYLVVPDPHDRRAGSGGATLNALRVLREQDRLPPVDPASGWWARERILMIHSGGDSRRLPQYSLSGKLFSALPVLTPWGAGSTVFDETVILSTAWAARIPAGLLVSSGDVVLTFDATAFRADRGGVTGVAIRLPAEVGSQHGVYIADEQGRVYSFLQKPSVAQIRAAGGWLEDGTVAVDSGLLHFAPPVTARLGELAASIVDCPPLDLYEHFTMALTGQWRPAPRAEEVYRRVQQALEGTPFWTSVVAGDFTHVGTTRLFQRLMTEASHFTSLYESQQRLGSVAPADVRAAGVVADSVLAPGSSIAPGAIALECNLETPVLAARGAILHGLEGIAGPVEAPEFTVLHQVPILTPEGHRGTVIRVYGVEDDPKQTLASGNATWCGLPFAGMLAHLGIDPSEVWPGIEPGERSLWNALLFPLTGVEQAGEAARWILRFSSAFTLEDWRRAERLSLESSALWADTHALSEARSRRMQARWQRTALELARAGSDIRPLLANSPSLAALAATGRVLAGDAATLRESSPTESASRAIQASLFLAQAGLWKAAEESRDAAFTAVRLAVDHGVAAGGAPLLDRSRTRWQADAVRVCAPPRIDFGGGWSDTPPFCLDWGGTVLNLAVEFDHSYPIHTLVRRLARPVIRLISEETGDTCELQSARDLLSPAAPGSPFAIPLTALRMSGLFDGEMDLARGLAELGGGLEIGMAVRLPLGSGLGTSSILAATVLRAIWEMAGVALPNSQLSDAVMRLEQLMTTGGGWQDQAGGIFPGAKLIHSAPGLRQRLRVEPLDWTEEVQAGFARHLVLYYTGIRRIARNLLTQVVASYLAREVATVQVLHSIKTLAVEMAYAMREGDWSSLGALMNRHWELNRVLDPHTTNAPINALLQDTRPFIAGAKLAGAGGGGFLMLIARDPDAASALTRRLKQRGDGAVYDWQIARRGLIVERG